MGRRFLSATDDQKSEVLTFNFGLILPSNLSDMNYKIIFQTVTDKNRLAKLLKVYIWHLQCKFQVTMQWMKLWVVRGFLRQMSLADADVDTEMRLHHGRLNALPHRRYYNKRNREKIFGRLSELLDFAFSVNYRLSLLRSCKMPPTTATEQSSRPDLHVGNGSEINLKERWVILLLDKIIIYKHC